MVYSVKLILSILPTNIRLKYKRYINKIAVIKRLNFYIISLISS